MARENDRGRHSNRLQAYVDERVDWIQPYGNENHHERYFHQQWIQLLLEVNQN